MPVPLAPRFFLMKPASFGQNAASAPRFSLVLKVVTLSAQSVEIILMRPLLRDQLVNSRRALFLLETACLEGGREGEGEREEGREGVRKGGREGGREEGREEGRKGRDKG